MMKTERLYYQDAYMAEFTAEVVDRRVDNGRVAVALDRTAFYPTGGGQPYDVGTLNDVSVTDVMVDDGVVWHVIDGDLSAGARVRGAVDWVRRLDHMQQHTGQHVLSEAFIKTLDAHTVAFHLGDTGHSGAAACTIDLDRADLDAAALALAEAAANAVVDAALPVCARFVADAELATLPLRKAPSVEGPIRIVEVQGYDWSACGGTHVANTAQIGLIKIVGSERRGTELRITFLCGGRARRGYARVQGLIESWVGRFSVGQDELPAAVDRLSEEARAVRKELTALENDWATSTAAALWAAAAPDGAGRRVVVQAVDYGVERAKKLVAALRTLPGAVAIIGVRGERPQLLFGRADDVAVNMGDLLKTAAAAGGGRGGGRPEYAQGGAPTEAGMLAALDAARARLSA
jgi:alanyl-tRNA synthetase